MIFKSHNRVVLFSMMNFTRQERVLLYSLACFLVLGSVLVCIKRIWNVNLFELNHPSSRLELRTQSRDLMVFVKGSVKRAGIYRLPTGTRVIDAVKMANPMQGADLRILPLADFIRDGQTITVSETPLIQKKSDSTPSAVPESPNRVNLNTADVMALDGLPGIGPEIASRVISYRSKHPFKSIDDLLKVGGVGKKKLDDLKDKVSVQ